MAFGLGISGTIEDQNGDPVEGMTVRMRNDDGGAVVDTDVTDASGAYLVSTDSTFDPAGDYFADPDGLSPHYTDPGQGSVYSWPGDTNQAEVDNFTSTFSNADPTVDQIANKQYEEDSGTKTVDANMSDADGDSMTPVKTQGPSWGTISKPTSSSLRWTFDTAVPTPGTYTFGYRVDDGFGGSSATKTFDVEITGSNNPPVWDPISDQSYSNNSGDHVIDGEATDPDGDPVSYSKVSGPTWVTINSTTGNITVDSDAATRGTFGVTVRASDNQGATADESFNVTITNNAPVLTNPGTKVYEHGIGTQQFDLEATDLDSDALTYSKVSGPAWVSVGGIGGGGGNTVSVDTNEAPAEGGAFETTWEVDDGNGGTDQETHDIVIGAVASWPMMGVIG